MRPERSPFIEEVELVIQDRYVRLEVETRPPPRERGRFRINADPERGRFRDEEETH